ncbi:MAG: tetratricopeptide repeat protein [Prevotella sp.]|nr:tetratricopeptide repeat protein [Prevotella sp.]
MSIQELIQHPELMNRETLYELRRITAEHPYYQTARLLLLKNLYLLHDSTFDEELRRSAIYITDRRVLFNLVEAAHYRLKRKSPQSFTNKPDRRAAAVAQEDDSRTVSLIDTFLSTIPEEDELKKEKKEEHRKPTAVDATTDYVAYLLSTDFEELDNGNDNGNGDDNGNGNENDNGNVNGDGNQADALIDAFINSEGKITLQEELEYTPEQEEDGDGDEMTSDEYLTETLAGIYIKQKRYKKALDIMEKVNEKANSNNKYYEDQKRFLELIIANSK